MTGPIKVRDIRNQLPQAGRIRAGKKVVTRDGKTAPAKLRNFRFTSPDRRSIEQVARLYGGEVTPWSDPLAAPGQFEVITETNEISVALPPDPLSDTMYELWAGSGCQRRCDGEMCTLARGGGPDGGEPMDVECVCARRGELECKLTTRLSVILPEVRFLGLWRLDTKGKNAAYELPGMVAGIQALQGREGFVRAVLRLEERSQRTPSGKRNFVVPMLGLDNTPDELIAGEAQLAPPVRLLDAPASCPGCQSVYSTHWPDCPNKAVDDVLDVPDDGVLVAEVIEVEPIRLTEFAGAEPGPTDPVMVQAWGDSLTTAQRAKVLAKARISSRASGVEPPSRFEEISLELLDELAGSGTP